MDVISNVVLLFPQCEGHHSIYSGKSDFRNEKTDHKTRPLIWQSEPDQGRYVLEREREKTMLVLVRNIEEIEFSLLL